MIESVLSGKKDADKKNVGTTTKINAQLCKINKREGSPTTSLPLSATRIASSRNDLGEAKSDSMMPLNPRIKSPWTLRSAGGVGQILNQSTNATACINRRMVAANKPFASL
jgi:hypothetical protein